MNRILVPSVHPENFLKVIELADRYEEILYTGHPSMFRCKTSADALKILEETILDVFQTIGLLGLARLALDFHIEDFDKEKMESFFHAQLSLAEKYRLPLFYILERLRMLF